MSGKYGSHGELFFFVVKKEQAIAPSNETFSPFINPSIRFACFSCDVLKKCALMALHVMAEEAVGMDFKSLSWGKNERWAAKVIQYGRVKAKLGRKTKV